MKPILQIKPKAGVNFLQNCVKYSKVLSGLVLVSVKIIAAENKSSLPAISLNHLYVVLDSKTYADLGKSEFLQNSFGGFTQKTTVANGGETWSGTYIMGEHTYFEFFQPSTNNMPTNSSKFSVGESGLGFSVEKEGDLKRISEELTKLFEGRTTNQLRVMKLGEKEVPWFDSVSIDLDDESFFNTWVMEYAKNFLRIKYPDLRPEEDGITRKQHLKRLFKENGCFRDISEITVALDGDPAARFQAELSAFGYAVKQTNGQKEFDGPGVKIFVIPKKEGSAGIVRLKLLLSPDQARKEHFRFGERSVLNLDGHFAVWTF